MSAVEWADRDHVAHIARAAVPASPLLYSVRYAVADAILASDWLAEHDRKIRAEVLRDAAEFLHNLAEAWGGDATWVTTGTKIASLARDVLRQMADQEAAS